MKLRSSLKVPESAKEEKKDGLKIFQGRIPFLASVLLGLLSWSTVAALYINPYLKTFQSLALQVNPILLLHTFRYVGLGFIVPGVVSPQLSSQFAKPAAFGDVAAALLAWLSFFTGNVYVIWIFNVVGTLDLLNAFYKGLSNPDMNPAYFQSMWFVPTCLVPLLLVTHFILFQLLLNY